VAPHATLLCRDGESKLREPGTAEIATLLATAVGGVALGVWSGPEGPAVADAASDLEAPLRRDLTARLSSATFMFDVHEMRDDWPMALCIGVGPCPTARTHAAAEVLAGAMTLAGFPVVIGAPLTAEALTSPTVMAHAMGCLGLQREIARRYRVPPLSDAGETAFCTALVDGLRQLTSERVRSTYNHVGFNRVSRCFHLLHTGKRLWALVYQRSYGTAPKSKQYASHKLPERTTQAFLLSVAENQRYCGTEP